MSTTTVSKLASALKIEPQKLMSLCVFAYADSVSETR